MNKLPGHLHYLIFRYIVENGHAPDLTRLASLAGASGQDAETGLRELERNHGVILEPGSTNIWSLHPFALLPTAFWVTAPQGGWWANCAWCALAIGAALHEDTTIATSDGAQGERLLFHIESGQSTRSGLLMHFPYPPANWWNNPYCPCGNILFFSSEVNIDQWRSRHGRPKGAILDMPTAIGPGGALVRRRRLPQLAPENTTGSRRDLRRPRTRPIFLEHAHQLSLTRGRKSIKEKSGRSWPDFSGSNETQQPGLQVAQSCCKRWHPRMHAMEPLQLSKQEPVSSHELQQIENA